MGPNYEPQTEVEVVNNNGVYITSTDDTRLSVLIIVKEHAYDLEKTKQ